jgi:hypothetical protein
MSVQNDKRRERVRDIAFITAMAIVLEFVSLAIWQKSVDGSNRGGEFRIFGRASTECRLPDGSVEGM